MLNHKLVSLSSDNDPKIARAGFMFRSQRVLKDMRDEGEQKNFLQDIFHDFGWETQNILHQSSSGSLIKFYWELRNNLIEKHKNDEFKLI